MVGLNPTNGVQRMVASSYLTLKVVEWSQAIRSSSKRDMAGRFLNAACKIDDRRDFKMSNGETFATRLVHIAILQGAPTEANEAPLEGGVGRLFYANSSDGEDLVHGWYFLNLDTYTTLWDQIVIGMYADCTVQLHVTPVDYSGEDPVWNVNQPLLIEDATINFVRTTRPVEVKEPQKRRGLWHGH
jgi:hypothetical protein